MPSLYMYRVFISHAWDYSGAYATVKGWLDDAKYFSWANYSVPPENALGGKTKKELQAGLSKQIAMSQVVIIISGMYVAHSDWIQYEIDEAKRMGKPIIGIKPWGSERTPQAVQDAANEMVGWNSASVVDAIRRLVN